MILDILIDADMFVFASCASIEDEVVFDTQHYLQSDFSDARKVFKDKLDYHIETVLMKMKWNGDFKVTMCFSGDNLFRKQIFPEYKMNRSTKRKPLCYHEMVNWVTSNFTFERLQGLEADDVMGILATRSKHSVIISGDKDLKSIPTYVYNHLSDELMLITEEMADRQFYLQTLMGDSTDNYKGCPKVGRVSANKLLDIDCSFQMVLDTFKKHGVPKKDALIQAQVARILRNEDYVDGEVCLYGTNKRLKV